MFTQYFDSLEQIICQSAALKTVKLEKSRLVGISHFRN